LTPAAVACRVYLISALISLEGNTTPTIEPYFLSLLGEHSMLSSVVIVMSVRPARLANRQSREITNNN
jgi:hypothetical protein